MNGGFSERLLYVMKKSILAALIYSLFEGIAYYMRFTLHNPNGLMEIWLWNPVIFLMVGIVAFLLLSLLAVTFRRSMQAVISPVLSTLVVFPVYAFLFSHLEGTGIAYKYLDSLIIISLLIGLPVFLLFLFVSRCIARGKLERFEDYPFLVFLFINVGQLYVDGGPLMKGKPSGILSLLGVAGVIFLIYYAFRKIRRPIARALQPAGARLGFWKLLLLIAALVCGVYLRDTYSVSKPETPSFADQRPNILLIVLDTLRADRMSCYGYRRDTTPFLKRFSENARLYRDVVSTAPWTLPSHASIFTGLYPSAHGATWKSLHLSNELVTMAEFFASKGYETAGFCNNPIVSEDLGMTQGFETYLEMWHEGVFNPALFYRMSWMALRILGKNDHGALRTNRWVMDWFRHFHDPGRPYFAFVNLMECHLWFDAPDGFHEQYLRDNHSRRVENISMDDVISLLMKDITLSEEEWRDFGDIYDGDLHYLDGILEKLFDFLEENTDMENTIVIITSDHGEHLGEHLLIDHQLSLYEPLLRVPLIIRMPNHLPPLPDVQESVQTVDIFPTLLDASGFEETASRMNLQGNSLTRNGDGGHDCLIAEYEIPEERIAGWLAENPGAEEIEKLNRRLKSIQVGSMKYIWSSKGDSELYDLASDPGELENLGSERPVEASALNKRLTEWLASFEHKTESGGKKELDSVTRQRLKALGYIK